ncbi:arylsulfatase L-like isoform X2 [Arvicanthis niloticus]|uniref:arylsulfatase L-like isoform X2 n=1 Tax=Arvicanthis niloticus TaxID=61156 RepID=UPI0014875A60|nr:arylsulfatase L-like isoform X2 [Arvicanthis niloticus]
MHRASKWPRPSALLCTLLLLPCAPALRPPPQRPSFLIIMADDLGIGDLGCYGNTTLRTPHIDRLAEDGVRLTQYLAAESLCTPSRAAFLTGRYPFRSGMTSGFGHRVLQWAAGAGGLPPEEVTFARILQERGYVTGLVGKWHLGLSCRSLTDLCHHPQRHGFHHFLGLPLGMMGDCAGAEPSEKRAGLERGLHGAGRGLAATALATVVAAMVAALAGARSRAALWAALALGVSAAILEAGSYVVGGAITHVDCFLMRNTTVTQQPLQLGRVNPLLLREAEDFLRRHSHAPFLLFLSLLHTHTPLVTSPAFQGRSQHGRYGDHVEEMDWVVGRILHTLDSLGLADRTLVHFTSDNGGWAEAVVGGERLGGWNGIFRGGKGVGGLEGGLRVPGIWRWPGVLPRGRVLDEPASLMDAFSTLVRLGGGTEPSDRVIDGRDLMPLLTGATPHSAHEVLLHYCEVFLHAGRWADRARGKVWKVHFTTPTFDPPDSGSCMGPGLCPCAGAVTEHDPPLLYELTSDPGEERPLAPGTEPAYAEVVAKLRQEHDVHHRSVGSIPQQLGSIYNVWLPWLQPCCGRFCACDLEGGAGSEEEGWGRDFLEDPK